MLNALADGLFESCGPRDHQLVSSDLDEVVDLLRRRVGPQKYEIRSRSKPFFAKIQFRQLSELTLSYGRIAPAMEITSTPREPYYSLFCRRYGSSEYRAGRQSFVTSRSCGAMLPGMQPVHVRTKEDWHVFGTRFPPETLRTELSRLLDRTVSDPVNFLPMVNFSDGPGRTVGKILSRLYEEATRTDAALVMVVLGIRHLERLLVTVLLEGLQHNYSKFLVTPEKKLSLWQVRAVEEFILENADQPLSLGDLATVGCTSARSLQYAFHRHRGYTPLEFLRQVRFERVQNDLRHPTQDTTVTNTATRWGFLHLGRFAKEYRTRFGESPSATIWRSLGRQ